MQLVECKRCCKHAWWVILGCCPSDISIAPALHKHGAMKDACYARVKAAYATFPSARASQAIAKCRKHAHRGGSSSVRKTAAGAALRRWGAEKWVNTKTGKPCGANNDRHAYCRPSKKISARTPVVRGGKKDAVMQRRKARGQRALSR